MYLNYETLSSNELKEGSGVVVSVFSFLGRMTRNIQILIYSADPGTYSRWVVSEK